MIAAIKICHCGARVRGGERCGNCSRDVPTPQRKEAKRFYSSTRWRKFRQNILAHRPLCELCHGRGQVTPAVDVHHLKRRIENPAAPVDPHN